MSKTSLSWMALLLSSSHRLSSATSSALPRSSASWARASEVVSAWTSRSLGAGTAWASSSRDRTKATSCLRASRSIRARSWSRLRVASSSVWPDARVLVASSWSRAEFLLSVIDQTGQINGCREKRRSGTHGRKPTTGGRGGSGGSPGPQAAQVVFLHELIESLCVGVLHGRLTFVVLAEKRSPTGCVGSKDQGAQRLADDDEGEEEVEAVAAVRRAGRAEEEAAAAARGRAEVERETRPTTEEDRLATRVKATLTMDETSDKKLSRCCSL